MNVRKSHLGWALKSWVLVSVFLIPFVGIAELVAWGLLGGAMGLWWRSLPEDPEAPAPEKLPFHDQYADRQVPRREPPPEK